MDDSPVKAASPADTERLQLGDLSDRALGQYWDALQRLSHRLDVMDAEFLDEQELVMAELRKRRSR
jgi:hypothetical protein